MNLYSNMSLLMSLMSVGNMGTPPSLNLLDVILSNSMIFFMNLILFVLVMMEFFSAFYSINRYSYSNHGKLSLTLFSSYLLTKYFLVCFYLFFPL